METLMLTSTVVDLAAVAVLAWLVWRSGHERDVALGEQRATLETLRGDLAQLIADAESRTRTLDAALGARETRLRALLAELGRAGAPLREAEGTTALEAAAEASRGGIDPAEARLLRDLEMSFGRG